MRRLILVITMLMVTCLAVSPSLVRARVPAVVRHTPAPEKGSGSRTGKKRSGASNSSKKKTQHKKSGSKSHKKSGNKSGKKSSKVNCKKHPKAKACHKKSGTKRKPAPRPTKTKPAPTRVPTATSVPTSTPAPTATMVPTPTATPLPTPTATMTPLPALAQIPVEAVADPGTRVVFYVCGLPQGVTASFSPNPVIAARNVSGSTYDPNGYARSTLTLASQWNVPARGYGLEMFAYYEGRSNAGGQLKPEGVVLDVNGDGTASAEPVEVVQPSGGQNCSAIPAQYAPTPIPTPNPANVHVSEDISNPTPAFGEQVTVSGHIDVGGQPVTGIPARFTIFTYGTGAPPAYQTYTDNGTASYTFQDLGSTPGMQVTVEVTFTLNGVQYSAYTSYRM